MEVKVEVSVKFEDLEKIISEINKFSEHLEDIKEMIAPLLGFRVKKDNDKDN